MAFDRSPHQEPVILPVVPGPGNPDDLPETLRNMARAALVAGEVETQLCVAGGVACAALAVDWDLGQRLLKELGEVQAGARSPEDFALPYRQLRLVSGSRPQLSSAPRAQMP